MPERSRNRKLDINQLAKLIVDEATAERPDEGGGDTGGDEAPAKDPAAVALGRRGGLVGGRARAEKLSPERRAEIARKAAEKRWGKASE